MSLKGKHVMLIADSLICRPIPGVLKAAY